MQEQTQREISRLKFLWVIVALVVVGLSAASLAFHDNRFEQGAALIAVGGLVFLTFLLARVVRREGK